MRPPVTYETKHPIDDTWPIEADCGCWLVRPADMPMMPICTAFNPDGRVTMRNMPYPEGVVDEDVWCGTCTHAGKCHWEQ